MKKFPRLVVLAALAAFASAACTSVASASALDALQKFASQTRSAQGNFTQHVVSRNNKVSDSSGDFQFARPGKFRWTYSKPYEQVLVADGEKFTMYDKDLNQVTVRKLNDALGSTPAAILFGDNALDKSFELKEAPARDGVEWLDATPKTHDTTFSRISIGFRNGELAAMELHDALGQVTQLTFLNVQRNPTLPADNFRFAVPKGADVLQN